MFNLFQTVYAATTAEVLNKNPSVKLLISKIADNIVNPIVSVLFLLAFFVFAYGIFGMISSEDDSDKRKEAKQSILWSVIGMVIMLSVFGIVRLIASTLGEVGVVDPFN